MMPTSVLRVRVVTLLILIAAPLNASAASFTDPPRLEHTHGGPTRLKSAQGADADPPVANGRQGPLWPLLNQAKERTASPGQLRSLLKRLEARPSPAKSVTTDGLSPPVQVVEGEMCWGYYDVMGHYDRSFNCTNDDLIFCCGTCLYRFCCSNHSRRLEQRSCKNFDSSGGPNTAPTERTHVGYLGPARPRSTQKAITETSSTKAGFLLPLLMSKGKVQTASPSQQGLKGLETPPKPLPQIMHPKNITVDALKPPHGAVHGMESQPRQLVEGDQCAGYYDVMGQYDLSFNCTKDDFIYCCGTCHYRFCCQDRSRRLDQNSCNNYNSPVWANTAPPGTHPMYLVPGPGFDRIKQHSNNTVYVIGGVISFTVAVAVAIKVAFHKASRQPRNRELNMPRALVDMLRHQSSPVQQGERNNSVALGSGGGEGTLGRPPKNLYPTLQNKDNRLGNLQHNFIHSSGSSPKHTATIERAPRMNNMQLAQGGTLKPSKHNNAMKPQPSFHHSLHNLAQLPPSYESAMKPEMNRYSSLKRLEKGLEDYSGYCTTKRRPNNAPPNFHSSQNHLHWGGDYTLGGRGTLPTRPRRHPQSAPTPTPNPYPLPLAAPIESHFSPNYDTLSKPPRRVKSTDQLLALADGSTLSRLSKNQQHQYYKAMNTAAPKNSNTHNTLRKSHDRLLMSPEHLEERIEGGGMGDFGGGGAGRMGDYGDGGGMGVPEYGGGGGMGMPDYASSGGMVPTLPRLTQHQKAQSQQNVCATPSFDRHHMIKMNSHPTSGREQERNPTTVSSHMGSGGGGGGGGGAGGVGWSEMPGTGVVMGTGTLAGHSARRLAFAAKRQNTIEQLHFIPGGGGGGSGGAGTGNQGVRTGSKNEVTV
ncbi:protein shisa-7 [Denticeps clupeoides]|uniref:Shisa N-terminal domain-containing protein n=1 Tax=Denticeps clupeoides TaxID=299321 RepID=A0AAY4A699_9TELE|nr:protein shisa-7-like [Denticeps clupeoides]XP_028836939.1 protein shisa-7-like [Denticeps clupeoides]